MALAPVRMLIQMECLIGNDRLNVKWHCNKQLMLLSLRFSHHFPNQNKANSNLD